MIGINKVGDYHLVYDGEPLSDHFIIKNVELSLLPNIDAITVTVDGRPGAWFSERKIETRKIIVNAAIMNDNRSRIDMMEKWMLQSDILAKNEECKLELGGGYYVNAILIGETPIKRENGYWSEVVLNFVCYDPYIYGLEHVDIINTGISSIMIDGKQPIYPVFDIEGLNSTASFKITNEISRKTVSVLSNYENSIKVDNENYICTKKGDVFVPVEPITEFFTLSPGYNVINLSAGSGTMTYRERYL